MSGAQGSPPRRSAFALMDEHGVGKMISELAVHHGFDHLEAEFLDGAVRVRGRIGNRTLEAADPESLTRAVDKLVREWPREVWPPPWLLPRERMWTPYPWPFGWQRDYYDRGDS